MALHDDEIPIDTALVRRLVDATRPAWADLPLRRLVASGSSNALFRLGDELLVRLPRQPGGSATIAKEARWLPLLARELPVAVPEVVAVGEPGEGYPERWSVVRWLPGEVPDVLGDRTGREALADDLAAVVVALGATAVPEDAVADPDLGWYRGGPLRDLDDDVRAAAVACAGLPGLELDLSRALALWDEALALPAPVPGARWLHGDLFAENLLVRDGRLAAVLDFGGLSVGDPSVDLVVAWELLDRPARERFRQAVAVDDATWLRGRAWAVALALITFPYYWTTMPRRCAERLALAREALAG